MAKDPIPATQPRKRGSRLQFIDALRGYAILMMLQGHFIYTMLAPEHRDPEQPLYALWAFMRGMTAPLFFTITGIIFVYLLLREGEKPGPNRRPIKGLRRGLMLIGLGYLLQVNVLVLMQGHWRAHWWTLDVLPCIGLALIGLVGLYLAHRKAHLPLPLLLLTAGVGAFLADPILQAQDWSAWPLPLANYFTKAYGSAFTPLPWMGYTFLGGLIGWHVHRDTELYRTGWWPLFFLFAGWLLHAYSSAGLMDLFHASGWEGFKAMAYNNYLLIRLGHVFIAIAVFLWIEVIWQRFPRLLLKAGSETLTLYAVHYVLLYSTWLGLGISRLGKYSWSPGAAAIGAVLFVAAFLVLTHYLDDLRQAWASQGKPAVSYGLRRARVLAVRQLRTWRRERLTLRKVT
ncbi:MAG: DUF1624 domain-containing protein [Bacteroidetes bacterium]|nr:MAG: DUF1624 domain-containing protein [Bacteroidota bacterium]